MLRALELYGFKSFADKTRFDFPPGITVIVGPNGSGKSNIVDAIKWVLGEQSAKSLRGKEMADVIFKGSGAGGRKMMNTAEATIVFDNSEHRLPVDSPEVHVTRRVYRSGEGEYLINGQPCRLKDVKDLFRGSGVGADAYSLIEQGKVDQLLQASPKDRRAIFEEAAGISRFKAKKIEAQRRIERVDQNLLRLSDIVEEVENRLKSVRAQAGKARRYREYTERLQQLRTHVALVDWRKLSEQLDDAQRQVDEQRQLLSELATDNESLEAAALQADVEQAEIGESLHSREAQLARNRELLAARQSVCDLEHARCRELTDEARLHRAQIAAAQGRAGDLEQKARELTGELSEAERVYAEISQRHQQHDAALTQLTKQWEEHRTASETLRGQHVALMRSAAQLGNEASRLASQIAAAETSADRSRRRAEETGQQLAASVQQFETLHLAEQQLALVISTKAAAVENAQRELAQNRRLLSRRHEDTAQLSGRRRGAAERAAVLEELENRREGILPGVKQILVSAQQRPEDPQLREVCGIAADLIRADVQLAPLVDAALGSAAQHVVLEGTGLLDQVASGQLPLEGRVGIISLARLPQKFEMRRVQWENRPGVIGRADRLVQADERFAPLVEFLLGRTYFVESLEHALTFYRMAPGRARFVTLAGEVVERDGTLVLGPQLASAALVSRRSELESLRTEMATLDRQIEAAVREVESLRANIEQEETALRRLLDEHQQLQEQLADHRVLRRSLEERCRDLESQRQTFQSEHAAAVAQQQRANEALDETQSQLNQVETEIEAVEQGLASEKDQLERIDQQRQHHLREVTQARIELATSEQRVLALRNQKRQLDEARQERGKALEEAFANYQRCQQRMTAAERAILEATTDLAHLFLEKEAAEREIASLVVARERCNQSRAELGSRLQQLRKRARRHEEQLHQLELDAGQLRHQRTTLAERIRDDYGVEIDQLEGSLADELVEQQRQEIEAEIAALRRKISNVGAVNLEALNELDELENRFTALSNQFQDLSQAKVALERIIAKINADSRRLFIETLEAIRANFQLIYRKAFGGGKADIVLEEGGDVLECGIDILATPPGKPTFNNSLLSGGEKALTAVSLLLAIFQFRPSPFCVLDEVDAPFDEANIGRFIDVLRDFLGWTKFVIVTHSKKTMTAATTLYGVTMQESGVSKRVSVRFEDVSETGEISDAALQREGNEPERGVA